LHQDLDPPSGSTAPQLRSVAPFQRRFRYAEHAGDRVVWDAATSRNSHAAA